MRKWSSLLLLTCSMALSLILGEVLVRVFLGDAVTLFPRYQAAATYGDFTIRRLRPDTTFWHTSIDGSWRFTVNAQGFRDDRDFAYAKDSDTLRIIALGDSNTEGFEVRQDHTYSAVTEKYLDSRGLESEVINTGVSGFGTAEEAVFLEHEGLRYHPDVAVLGFYANDFEDNIKSDLFRIRDSKLFVHKKSHVPGVGILRWHNAIPPLRWLSENSELYSLTMNTIWETFKSALLSRKREELELAVATKQPDAYEKQLAASLIERMYRLCRKNHVKFIVVDIPQFGPSGEYRSSISADLIDDFERNSDALILSDEALSPYRHIAEFHVPHGQHHISELAHMLLAVEIARTARRLLAGGAPAAEVIAHCPTSPAAMLPRLRTRAAVSFASRPEAGPARNCG